MIPIKSNVMKNMYAAQKRTKKQVEKKDFSSQVSIESDVRKVASVQTDPIIESNN